jgi:N,N'-diacetylbacillosaminyl-diphospho-undecaprenol alpha-1,3-N-acetylgalactosaminyltransferase
VIYKEKIKIAFLSHLDLNLYLFRTPIMKELLKQGHTVYAICPVGEYNKKLNDLGVKVINYEIERGSINPFKEKKFINNIYEVIKNLDLDILHTFTAKPNIYGTFAGKKAGVPVILNLVEGLGSFYVSDTLKNIVIRNIMEYLYKKVFRLSNGCVFVNSDDPKYMIQKGIIKKEKVKIIKSVGVDIDKFNINNFTNLEIENKKKELKVENKLIIMMIARAIWDKGIKEFYEVANELKKEYDNIEFILIGNTDEGNYSCASKEFLTNGDVKWLGHKDDINSLIAISDIFVLPSYYREGVPVTLMEAASMSKPIVTTNTVGCREVVEDGVNGYLVPVKDTKILKNKIKNLIENKELRIEMGKKGRKKVEKEFDVKIVINKYMDYYKGFLDEKSI